MLIEQASEFLINQHAALLCCRVQGKLAVDVDGFRDGAGFREL